MLYSVCPEAFSFRDNMSPSNGARHQLIKRWSPRSETHNRCREVDECSASSDMDIVDCLRM